MAKISLLEMLYPVIKEVILYISESETALFELLVQYR